MKTEVIVPSRDSANKQRLNAEFARRLEIACEGNPHCPTDAHRGKQKWIYDNLLSRYGIKVSPEAVRKWFAAETMPRQRVGGALSQLLNVDEGWLMLGLKPDMAPQQKAARSTAVSGAVNIVAGMIQAHGGSIAFLEDTQHEIAAIIDGKFYTVEVRLSSDLGMGKYRLTPSAVGNPSFVVAVVPGETITDVDLVLIPTEIISRHGERRGEHWELELTMGGKSGYWVGEDQVHRIQSLNDLRRELTK